MLSDEYPANLNDMCQFSFNFDNLIKIIERLNKKNNSNSPFKCLHKKIKYNISEILEEKIIDNNNNEKNRFNVLYEQKSKIIFYDDLFYINVI